MQPPLILHCKPRQVHELRAVRLACDRILASPVGACAIFARPVCRVASAANARRLQTAPDIDARRADEVMC